MKPFFSIIIPLYNKEQFIENTLKSVFEQTFQNFEILIINDGSTDRSVKVIEKFQDKRIRLIHQTNQGASAARNRGIEAAQADYICFLDADDYWYHNHLEVLHNLIYDFPKGGLYCNRYSIKVSHTKIIKLTFDNIDEIYNGYVEDYYLSSLKNRIASSSSIAIRKSVFEKVGLFDKNISSGQDIDMWIRIVNNYPVVISNKITAVYNYQIPNTLSKTNILNKKIMDFKKFEAEEKQNPSLKRFLDLYRIEYALHYHISGFETETKNLLACVDKKHIGLKTKILFHTPSATLKVLLKIKHFLKAKGINFSVYH